MALLRLLIAAGLSLAVPAPAMTAPPANPTCLSKEGQREVFNAGKAIGLAMAIRAAKRRIAGEVVKAQLCEEPGGALVYVLTVLARSGKVTRMVIDAANGAIAGER
jgi:uncharacterized membrane protein YkoI